MGIGSVGPEREVMGLYFLAVDDVSIYVFEGNEWMGEGGTYE